MSTDCPPRRPWFDAAISFAMAAILVTLILVTDDGPRSTASLVAALVLALVQASTILWIQRRPELAMITALTAGAGIQAIAPHVGWLGLAAAPLAYFAWIRPPRVSIWALAVGVVAAPWTLVTGGYRDLLLAVFAFGFSWAWGELGRTRWTRRQEERQRIIDAERSRIARELHDVVAHTVSVMVVQAGAAADVFDARPDKARAALDTIQEAGRTALDELRAMLRTMRLDDAGDEPRTPQPGLDQLDALARSLGATGLVVALDRAGDERPVPPDVALSAYRIVQESLTNSLRHGRAKRADVRLRFVDGELRLDIVDDGDPAAAVPRRGGGHGLTGMRERARLLGGTLDAGPLATGGFQVSARLPLRQQAAA
ncbi:sensor histidine kinase [Asanoa iriomotensis]|uniref:histidine kinase n=1 Tax=Asanoa iriomotensis TaxID=234613 RepID=A0ABQ4CF34_9ACTN|nr:sensor histidine kinase [Asanoa iriomotensis]GIF61387.1 two-component sensor histidine kinase [Asanoa iriomotensis]